MVILKGRLETEMNGGIGHPGPADRLNTEKKITVDYTYLPSFECCIS